MEWRHVQTTGGPAGMSRHGHTATLLSGRIFVYGGRTAEKDHIPNIHIFDPSNLTWKTPRVRSNPPSRVFHTANALEGDSRITVFGGSGHAFDGRSVFHNDVWLYIADRTFWELCSVAGEPPAARAAHASVMLTMPRAALVVCGGTNSVQTFGDTWVMAIASARWEQLETTGPPMPPQMPPLMPLPVPLRMPVLMPLPQRRACTRRVGSPTVRPCRRARPWLHSRSELTLCVCVQSPQASSRRS